MPQGTYIDGYNGAEISLLVDGIKLAAVQKLDWKASQKKSLIRGGGYSKPHGVGRGPKEYELSIELKELNAPVISQLDNSPRSGSSTLKKFKIGDQEFSDLLDLRNLEVVVLYPAKNNLTKMPKFYGVEFTENSGGFSVEDEAIGRKLSATAMDAEGLV